VRRSRRYWPMTRCASRPNNPRENRVGRTGSGEQGRVLNLDISSRTSDL
jgi:hypothetical protein